MWNGIFLPRQSINKANFLDEENQPKDEEYIEHIQTGPFVLDIRNPVINEGGQELIEVDAQWEHFDVYHPSGTRVPMPSNEKIYTYRFASNSTIENNDQAVTAIIEYHSNN